MSKLDEYKEALKTQTYIAQGGNLKGVSATPITAQGVGETLLDTANNVIIGASKGVEGLGDAVLVTSAAASKLSSKAWEGINSLAGKQIVDADKKAQASDLLMNMAKEDLTGKYVTSNLDKLTPNSYLNDNAVGHLVEATAQGVGGMLPSVAAAAATGGLSTAAGIGTTAASAAAQTASLATMGVQAYGNAAAEALADGAKLEKAVAYGAVSGAVEVATEKMFGTMGNITGKGWLDDIGGAIAKKTGMPKLIANGIEEGLEEVASAAVEPVVKSIYQGKDAYDFSKQGVSDYVKNIGESFVTGALTSMAFNETVGRATHQYGAEADIAENISDAQNSMVKLSQMQKNGTITNLNKKGQSKGTVELANAADALQAAQKTLTSLSEKRRAKVIERYGLSDIVNSDGTFKSEYLSQNYGFDSLENESIINHLADIQNNVKSTHSYSMSTSQVNTALSDYNTKSNANVTEYQGDMSDLDGGTEAVKLASTIESLSQGKIQFVFVDSLPNNAHGLATTNSNTGKTVMFISAANAQNGIQDAYTQAIIHEGTHGTEGTAYHRAMQSYLEYHKNIDSQVIADLKARGYFTDAEIAQIKALAEKNADELTADEKKLLESYNSEYTAAGAELVLGTQEFADWLTRSDIGLVQKILNKLDDLKAQWKNRNNDYYKFYKDMQNMYITSLKEAGYRYVAGKVIKGKDDDDENVVRESRAEDETYKKAAAKSHDYVPLDLYHGTESFGFTDFDLQKMDDKTSIFLTSSKKIASTYSGVIGERSISESKKTDVQDMSAEAIVDELNSEQYKMSEDDAENTSYHYYTVDEISKLKIDLSNRITQFEKQLEQKIKEYADKMAKDFNGNDFDTHDRLVNAYSRIQQSGEKDIGIVLWTLNQYTDVFDKKMLHDLERDIRLNAEIGDAKSDVIIKDELDGYSLETMSLDEAKSELSKNRKKGNYKVYAKLGKTLDIDAKGQYWNAIKNWQDAIAYTADNTSVYNDGLIYYLFDSDDNVLTNFTFTEEMLKNYSDAMIHGVLLNKKNSVDKILLENVTTTREIAQEAKRRGYDSVIFRNLKDNGGRNAFVGYDETADIYVIFNPNNIKSADLITYDDNGKIIPLSERFNSDNTDIRYSRDKSNAPKFDKTVDMSTVNAKYSDIFRYTQKRAAEFSKSVLADMALDDKTDAILGDFTAVLKNKGKITDYLYEKLNSATTKAERTKAAQTIADYIIDNTIYKAVVPDDVKAQYAELSYLRGKLNLDSIKDEIRHRYDKSAPAIIAQWGGGTENIDTMYSELGYIVDQSATNTADMLFNIYEKARALKAEMNALKKGIAYTSVADETLISETRQKIVDDIMKAYSELGDTASEPNAQIKKHIGKLTDERAAMVKRLDMLQSQYGDLLSKNFIENKMLWAINRLANMKKGIFVNASKVTHPIFKGGTLGEITQTMRAGNAYYKNIGQIVNDLSAWFNSDNPILASWDKTQIDALKDRMQLVQSEILSEGKLSNDGMKALGEVASLLYNISQNYNKVKRNGKLVDAMPIAEKMYGKMSALNMKNAGNFRKLCEYYLEKFGDPMTVARMLDNYQDGFFTQTMEEFRQGVIKAALFEMNMTKIMEGVRQQNRNLLNDFKNKTVEYQGQQIPLGVAVYVYMALHRKQAQAGLIENGFEYRGKDGKTVTVEGLGVVEEEERLAKLVKAREQTLEGQFDKATKDYIKAAETIFLFCRDAKYSTDIARMGFSNVTEGYYVPIKRGHVAHNVDDSVIWNETSVTNAAFNKSTVKHAAGILYASDIESVVNNHIRGMSRYYGMAEAIDNYNTLNNLNLSDNDNAPQTLGKMANNVWNSGSDFFRTLHKDNFSDYFNALLESIKGVPSGDSGTFANRIIGKLVGNTAKFQLGANPKVWVTQLSSLFASMSILDAKNVTKAMALKVSDFDVDKYCPLAALRAYDRTAAKAQSLLENFGTVGDVMMKPIGFMDRYVVKRLFAACMLQSEGEYGSEANKIAAGKLLEKVILETQQNSMATERSEAMRTNNSLTRALTMYRADAMKTVGRVIDGIGEYGAIRAKLKTAAEADKLALEQKLKKAGNKAGKAIGALVAQSIFMTLVAQGFRLIRKQDEDKDAGEITVNMVLDTIGNLIGGLPVIVDIFNFYSQGYELNNYEFSAITDLADSALTLAKTAGTVIDGDATASDIGKAIRTLMFSGGQLLGLPTRNVYNYSTAILKWIVPSAGYAVDNFFYGSTSLKSDLAKAIADGDDAQVSTIAGIMLDNSDELSKSARTTLRDLTIAGYDVIPTTAKQTVTVNGESYTMTKSEYRQFKATYAEANTALETMSRRSAYISASDEVKAKAVTKLYKMYYNIALDDLSGGTTDSKDVLFSSAISPDLLALIIAQAQSLEADTDRNGNAISGSRKAKIQKFINAQKLTAAQKYMLMGYLGYTNANGKAQVQAYINTLTLTKTQKQTLLTMSGY